jgi:hypothetical protein
MKTSSTGGAGTQWYSGNGIVDAEVGGVGNDWGTSLLSNKLAFGIGNPDLTIQSTSNVNTGNWVHVAATWKQSTGVMQLYINGILEATTSGSTNARNAPPRITMGEIQTDISRFNGSIDELRIWNTVRAQAQIKANLFNRNLSNGASGLVGYYRFNEGSGTNSGNSCTNTSGIDGTLTNGPAWVSSPVQYAANALSFDGTNDYVSIPDDNALDITTAITLEAWVYATKNSGVQNVISKSSNSANNGYIFPRTDDGWAHAVVYLQVGGGWQTLSAVYPSLNAWHHLAATYDGATMKLYIDGTLAASRAQTGTITTNANPLALGNQTGFSEYFGGYGDEFRIWNVARTQTEIQNSMNTELDPALQTGLVSYYNVNQGSASGSNTGLTTLPDQKGNNNGTLANFSLSGASSNFVTQNSGMFVLPLKWISFTVQKQNSNALLQWTTASEINTFNFIIERSEDANNWENIGLVLSKNNNKANDYSYVDASAATGINYYRIRQNDRDGKYNYSETRTVRMNGVIRCFDVVANPVINKLLQLKINTSTRQRVTLSSGDGKLVWIKELSPGMHAINLSNLTKGIYILSNGNYGKKLIVQ